MKCQNCFKEIEQKNFCIYCGTPVKKEEDKPVAADVASVNTPEPEIPKPVPDTEAKISEPAVVGVAAEVKAVNTEELELPKHVSDSAFHFNEPVFAERNEPDKPAKVYIPESQMAKPAKKLMGSGSIAEKKKINVVFIALYSAIIILTIILGSSLGFLVATDKIPFLSKDKQSGKSSEFRWNNQQDAVQSVIAPGFSEENASEGTDAE